MSDNEWIELILLQSCGDSGHALLERFDREVIAAIRLELILNWLLTETTVLASDGRTLDSQIVCTPEGEIRRRQLEENAAKEKDDLARWVNTR